MGLTDTGWLKAAKTTSLRRQIHCDVICHTTARRRSWQLSPDSEIGPSDPTLPGHSWGQYLVGTIPRSIRICVPNVVMIGPAVWPPILDRHTHTHTEFVLYRYRLLMSLLTTEPNPERSWKSSQRMWYQGLLWCHHGFMVQCTYDDKTECAVLRPIFYVVMT